MGDLQGNHAAEEGGKLAASRTYAPTHVAYLMSFPNLVLTTSQLQP